MDENYKGHQIQSTARYLRDSGRWLPHIVINWTNGPRGQSREFDVRHGFATEVDAEADGLAFTKQWIDNGKPRIRVKAEQLPKSQNCQFADRENTRASGSERNAREGKPFGRGPKQATLRADSKTTDEIGDQVD